MKLELVVSPSLPPNKRTDTPPTPPSVDFHPLPRPLLYFITDFPPPMDTAAGSTLPSQQARWVAAAQEFSCQFLFSFFFF